MNKTLVLERRWMTERSTGGWMNGMYTLELPWRDNQVKVSCIPVGEYECALVDSPKFGKVYGVAKVPGRSHILIHYGNYPSNTDGCILLGMFHDVDFVGNSRKAFGQFMEEMAGEPFQLIIRQASAGLATAPPPT